MTNQRSDPNERFMSKVLRSGDCWLWTGPPNHAGYGAFYVRGRRVLAHRYAWEMTHGHIPEGMSVDHTCFVRACVNPSHLRLLTVSENCSKTRKALSMFCRKGHEYTPENTYFNPPKLYRVCKTCRRARMRQYEATQRARLVRLGRFTLAQDAPRRIMTTWRAIVVWLLRPPSSANRTDRRSWRVVKENWRIMTTTWTCLEPGCPATGDTQAGAERHVRETRHATSQVTVP